MQIKRTDMGTVEETGQVASGYDPRALLVAQAVQSATGIETMILFGSRARGDWHEHSDIDLLLIHRKDRALHELGLKAAEDAILTEYGQRLSTDLVMVAPHIFDICQHGLHHVAARAVKEGVNTAGMKLNPPSRDRSPELPRRREAMKFCHQAAAAYGDFEFHREFLHQGRSFTSQRGLRVGRACQEALELGLKALMAAYGVDFDYKHDLVYLAQMEDEQIPACPELQSPLEPLTKFAGAPVYSQPALPMEPALLMDVVEKDLTALLSLVQAICDFDPWSVEEADFEE